MESRYNDTTPVRCEDCGWQGRASECIHTYRGYGGALPDGTGEGDIEPVDECPKCHSENLIPIEQEPATV